MIRKLWMCLCVKMTQSFYLCPALQLPFILFFHIFVQKTREGLLISRIPIIPPQCKHKVSSHFSFSSCYPSLSQQQRKEREMVRQQEKGPHRRLDDMRREEDRRMAEREQVTNHKGMRGRSQPIGCGVWACPPATL